MDRLLLADQRLESMLHRVWSFCTSKEQRSQYMMTRDNRVQYDIASSPVMYASGVYVLRSSISRSSTQRHRLHMIAV
jgi:hypothetical protein